MKKFFIKVLNLVILTLGLISCTEEPAPIAVSAVTLNSTSMTLVEGDTQTLIATVSPSNAENKKVIWTSSNSSVASVKEGVVTALKAGKATVTAKSDDGGKTATCEVTVNAKVYPVTGVTLDKTSYEMTEGDEFTLTATVNPSNATNKNVSWKSSNTSVATVSNGKVTALKAGTTTITVTTEDGSKTATCSVTVNAKVYPVTGVSLDKTTATLTEGETLTLTATVNPSNATNKNVSWKSSNTSVATVSGGKVTALKAGSATITVTTEDGSKTATCSVTVNAKVYPVTSVSLNKSTATLTEGETLTLTATVNPSNATNKNVSWKSSNTSVATVSNGKVTAVKAGSATITVTTEDGGKTATCSVTVKAIVNVTSVSLNKTTASLTEGESLTLTASINPSNATNKNVTWKSSNTSVATVSNGKVTAVKAGSATITVTTKDGNKTATCSVTVNEKVYPVSGVYLNKTSVSVVVGNKLTLVATITPSNATNKNITWNSSNTSVATVSPNGEISTLSPGTANIVATTVDGKYTATCKITVVEKVVSGGNESTSDEDWGI